MSPCAVLTDIFQYFLHHCLAQKMDPLMTEDVAKRFSKLQTKYPLFAPVVVKA